MQLMPEYYHEVVNMPIQRVMDDFRKKERVCFSTWIHNSTPELVFTSAPNIYYFPLGIITLQKNRSHFSEGVVSLDAVMRNENIIFGHPKGRGYGKELDAIVEKYRGNENFLVRTAEDSTTGIMKMILHG